ncbi:serine/threonine-protein kinase ATG1c-like isoform X1 [Salvia splendens]|uniref:serine/threonine-protein kinase ATG1c-like isoform X1 n=1 Tax=Salvia splendens TaxID=180675 RepID=UPI001C27910A|nr:serine/threonine-protein kinase ATG1c-like isoform X1 [Salvia splendens]
MAQRGYYVVGDYVVGKQIGAGSFSTVWHARHRVHGTEVAIKEIATSRLNPKLQDSLKSEIVILKKINHPNIIRLHDMLEEPGKMYIVLEYCRGGDLSIHLQRLQGGISEATTKRFMQQLAEGLKVLRENNLIHRDLKPQNLLLSSNGDNSILKIADFGFARSLQPLGLAETLCGSPLYMAPEIMQLQRYDAKADLWSVGVILFQLVTGKTPFTGVNQIQLLQNIIKATDLKFPPEAKDLSLHCMDLCRKLLRRNPVERLTFEEFFNHPYLSQRQLDESFRNRQSERVLDGFPLEGNTDESFDEDCLPECNTAQSLHEECLPFSLDEESSGTIVSPSYPETTTKKSTHERFSPRKEDITGPRVDSRQGKLKGSPKTMNLDLLLDTHPKKVDDPVESIDKDYVIVPGSPMKIPSVGHAFKASYFQSKYGSAPSHRENVSTTPYPIIGGRTGKFDRAQGIESPLSAPEISHGSVNNLVNLELPSTDYTIRISSLQRFAAAIRELVKDKIKGGMQLEAFSVQLVILAIWKQALHICHTHAASAMHGSPSHDDTRSREVSQAERNSSGEEFLNNISNRHGPVNISEQIERAFLQEVEHAEELAKVIEPGNKEIPDAMELIYQSALALGRHGAVDEYMGDTESAVIFYSKSVHLFRFLLVEAPCLALNPQFSLTNSDRYRVENYINAIMNRHNISRSQKVGMLKGDHHPSSS